MQTTLICRVLTCAMMLVVLPVLTGCDPQEPAPAYLVDMNAGDSNLPLPPATRVFTNPKVVEGEVELPPFRMPGTAPAEGSDLEGYQRDIFDAVKGFTEAVNNANHEEIASFLVEEQATEYAKIVDREKALNDRIKALAEKAEQETPGIGEKVDALLAEMSDTKDLLFELEEVTSDEDGVAVAQVTWPHLEGPMAAMIPTQVTFKRDSSGEWFMEHPFVSIAITMSEVAFGALENMVTLVEDGTLTMDLWLTQMEALMQAGKGEVAMPDAEGMDPAALLKSMGIDPSAAGEDGEAGEVEEQPEGEEEPKEEGGGGGG